MWVSIIITIFVTIVGLILVAYVIVAGIFLSFRWRNKKCKSKTRLDGKTALVTGGTAGMGLEIAKEIARRGARLIIASPFDKEGTDARNTIVKEIGNKNVTFKLLDLGSLKSVREFAQYILNTENRLDILVNNAGVLGPNNITADGLNFVMQVNYFGHFLLTLLLLPLLNKSGTVKHKSRIINTSSLSHICGKVKFDNTKKIALNYYFDSKLCVSIFTAELAKRIKNYNVVVNTADPGVAATNIAKSGGKWSSFLMIIFGFWCPSAMDGAQTSLHLLLDEAAGKINGEYFSNCQQRRAHKKMDDDKTSKILWEESVRLVGLKTDELFILISRKNIM